jgi:hypothetical protein
MRGEVVRTEQRGCEERGGGEANRAEEDTRVASGEARMECVNCRAGWECGWGSGYVAT